MFKYHRSLVWLLFLSLSACYTNHPLQVHRAACRDLKSKIIFNAATSETRRAEIDRAEEPLQLRTYDVHCEE